MCFDLHKTAGEIGEPPLEARMPMGKSIKNQSDPLSSAPSQSPASFTSFMSTNKHLDTRSWKEASC